MYVVHVEHVSLCDRDADWEFHSDGKCRRYKTQLMRGQDKQFIKTIARENGNETMGSRGYRAKDELIVQLKIALNCIFSAWEPTV